MPRRFCTTVLPALALLGWGTTEVQAQTTAPTPPAAPLAEEDPRREPGSSPDAPPTGTEEASPPLVPHPTTAAAAPGTGTSEASGETNQGAVSDPISQEDAFPAGEPLLNPALPRTAHVQLHVDRAGAWLELRDDLAGGQWHHACDAPCDQSVNVYAMEARLNGPRMTPSNAFRIEPGVGAARFKVRSGSLQARRWGTAMLAAGLPVAAAGFAGYGYGEMTDQPGFRDVGAIALGAGATAVVTAFVLVSRGATRVRDARGRRIARVSTDGSL